MSSPKNGVDVITFWKTIKVLLISPPIIQGKREKTAKGIKPI